MKHLLQHLPTDMENLMHLKILLPYRVFLDTGNVSSVVLETTEGFYGFLPHRLDCVSALVPGIFTYETEGNTHYLAIDEGICIKAGLDVLLSVRNAIGGTDLGKLHESINKEFLNLDENEKNIKTAMVKLESGLINSVENLSKE